MDNTTIYGKRAIAAACLLGAAAWSGTAPAAGTSSDRSSRQPVEAGAPAAISEEAKDAFSHINEAIRVLRTMEADAGLRNALQRAPGVFVLPDYGRAALGVGARGGAGVLFVKRGGAWSNPAFYTLGGLSVGLQAGAEGGSIAMILNNQKALNSFKQNNNFSLNADAGLTVITWSGKGQASVGKGDVIMWSDTAGLFGDVSVSVTNINFDEDETSAYYGQQIADPGSVIDGRVTNPHATALKRGMKALPSEGGQSMPANENGAAPGSRPPERVPGKPKADRGEGPAGRVHNATA